MKTHHRMTRDERQARANATEQVQQAVQAAMDRRDNGGETGHQA